jgi:hypothetical protein
LIGQPPVRTNYVLIDYENVQPAAMAVLVQEHFRVIVFVGANQAKVTFDIAEALHRLGTKAEYIKISGNGKNALDFHIAFYIGHLAAVDPNAHFHIISKDAGFDPLVAHLKRRNIRVSRSKELAGIPLAGTGAAKVSAIAIEAAGPKTPIDQIAVIVANLWQRGPAVPGTVKTLSSTINAIFQKKLSSQEVGLLMEALKGSGIVTVTGTKVSYNLPPAA